MYNAKHKGTSKHLERWFYTMTIEALKDLVLMYRKQMKENKIPVGVIGEVKMARKNARYFAITEIMNSGKYKITFSGVALLAGKKSLKNTILHELCHTCKGAMNHGEKFKKYGKIVYDVFGENIETHSTQEENNAVENYKSWMASILFKI